MSLNEVSTRIFSVKGIGLSCKNHDNSGDYIIANLGVKSLFLNLFKKGVRESIEHSYSMQVHTTENNIYSLDNPYSLRSKIWKHWKLVDHTDLSRVSEIRITIYLYDEDTGLIFPDCVQAFWSHTKIRNAKELYNTFGKELIQVTKSWKADINSDGF